MRKYLLFCLAFCVLGCLAQDLIVRPNDPIIYKKEGGAFLWLGDTAWELFHVLDKEEIVHYLDNRLLSYLNWMVWINRMRMDICPWLIKTLPKSRKGTLSWWIL